MEPQNIAPMSPTTVLPTNNVLVNNTSGQGALSVVPEEIKGWSWGAFGFNWIWGLFNGTYIALLTLIPYVGFVMVIVLGIKGKEWAWRNKKWDSIEHFKKVQRTWSRVFWIIFGVLMGIALLGMITAILLASINSARQKALQARETVQSAQQSNDLNASQSVNVATSTVWTDPAGRFQIQIPATFSLGSLNMGEVVATASADGGVTFYVDIKPTTLGENNDTSKKQLMALGYKVSVGSLDGEDAISGSVDNGSIYGLIVTDVHGQALYSLIFKMDSSKRAYDSELADANYVIDNFKFFK